MSKPDAVPEHNIPNGVIHDGMLVRMSRISSDPEQAYRDHDAFIAALIGSLSPQARLRLAGLPG